MYNKTAFEPNKSSPLAEMPEAFAAVSIQERPFVGKVNLRGNPDDEAFSQAVEKVLGKSLPTEPNTTASNADHTIFWLGPNEWLIHCQEDKQLELAAALQSSLQGQHVAVTDVSDYYFVIRLSGEKTLELLSKSVPLDLHPRAFAEGNCAQTHVGHATILLHKIADDQVDVQVRWSFAEYLWTYFREGTREYL